MFQVLLWLRSSSSCSSPTGLHYLLGSGWIKLASGGTFDPDELPGGGSTDCRCWGHGRSIRPSIVSVRLRISVPSSWHVRPVRPQPPAGGEPRVPVPGWGGRRPGLSHLLAAPHPAAGHALRSHLLPGVSHQLPAGERLLPCVPHAADAAELQEVQCAGAQAAGQADCGLSLHRSLHWGGVQRRAGRPHQKQVKKLLPPFLSPSVLTCGKHDN